MNAVFRVDFSDQIGLGHLMRCITLADALHDRGYKCHFISRVVSNPDLVTRTKHNFIQLTANKGKLEFQGSDYSSWLGVAWQQDAEETVAIIEKLAPDWLIIDHYAIDYQWENILKNYCAKILVIDDLANRQHACDMLIDSNFGRVPTDYSNLVPEFTHIFTGSEYVMLKPEFTLLREKARKRRDDNPEINNILVFLGGGDPENTTERALSALLKLTWDTEPRVIVVLGAANPNSDLIRAYLDAYPLSSELHIDTGNMAELTYGADLAIGASGGATWERCCLGLPTLSVVIAENQQFASENLGKAGLVENINMNSSLETEIATRLQKLLDTPERVKSMSKKCFELVDGKGIDRIVQNMKQLEH